MDAVKLILRKHLASVICGVVALIALVALFYPVGGMYEKATGVMEARQSEARDIQAIVQRPRSWPVIPNLDVNPNNSQTTPLKRFPNQPRIDVGTRIRDEVAAQAKSIAETTNKENIHVPMAENLLPTPKDRYLFAKQFSSKAEELKNMLSPTVPPTETEIKTAASELYTKSYGPNVLFVGVDKRPINLASVVADWQAAADKLPLHLRLDRAHAGKVYIEPDALPVSHARDNSQGGPHDAEIWYDQNILWVEEDIFKSLNQTNSKARDVTDAPVKQIIKLDIPEDQSQYVTSATSTGGGGGNADAGNPFLRTPTGRVTNADHDVLHFTLTMRVDASKVGQIIADLQRFKLLTVTQMDLQSVDGIAAADAGYVFGDVPVVKLVITGEDVYLRKWTTPLMPDPIKLALGVGQSDASQQH